MSTSVGNTPREWDAASYHRVANPHVDWGTVVLERLPLRGDETVVDLGCGTGRLTELVLQRVPQGQVIAVDGSARMIAQARAHLEPQFPDQVDYIVSDILALELESVADVVFSTATFHWIADHQALFAVIHRALKPGGIVLAQCGGGPNIAQVESRAMAILREEPYRALVGDWAGPWNFAGVEETETRLQTAGFEDVHAELVHAPVTFENADAYREFLTTVVLGSHLERLPSEELRIAFIDRLVEAASTDEVPFSLDYWRLNLTGTKPAW